MSVAALLSLALGVISDLLRTNRILLEEQLERIKEMQYRPGDRAGNLVEELGTLGAAHNSGAPVRALGESAGEPANERSHPPEAGQGDRTPLRALVRAGEDQD